MEKRNLINWLRLAVACVCICVALILLMAEPRMCGSIAKWFGVFVATKAGAIACGFVAYLQIEALTKDLKN